MRGTVLNQQREAATLRICLIVEERYRTAHLPMAVGDHLRGQGHEVTILEPHATATCLGELTRQGEGGFDVSVLKTASEGPGRSLIEAAAASGVVTVNDARAIRLVRDKAVAAAVARAHGIPFPVTYFLAHPQLLTQVPAELYPLVVKPANGSECRDIHLVESPTAAWRLLGNGTLDTRCFLIAQPYQRNCGYDIKVYNAGGRVFALRRPSPLSTGCDEDEIIPVAPELRRLVLRIGRVFGLDIYGVDVLQTEKGWTAVDVNDFPSFGGLPEAVGWIADTIVGVTRRRMARRPLAAACIAGVTRRRLPRLPQAGALAAGVA